MRESIFKGVVFCTMILLMRSSSLPMDVPYPTNSCQKLVKLPKYQRAEGRAQFEFEMTKDPKSNLVPRERLLEAKKYADKLRDQKSAIPNIHWMERGPNNVSGRTRTIIIDANDPTGNSIFAAGVSGGLWKSIDKGATWTEINPFFSNLAICALAQDPSNPNIIYFGTGEGNGNSNAVRGMGMWKSIDGGLTFEIIPASLINYDFGSVNKIVVDNAGTVFASTNGHVACNAGGLMISTDGGDTFTIFQDPDHCGNDPRKLYTYSSDVEVAANGDIYAGFGKFDDNDGIYKSSDGGTSWTLSYASAPGEVRVELATAPSNPNIIYALLGNSGDGDPKIIKSVDAGATWSYINEPTDWQDLNCIVKSDWTRKQDWFNLSIAVDPNNEDHLMIGGIDLFKSVDGGNSWNQVSHWLGTCGFPKVHGDQHTIVFANSNEIWFGNDGGVYHTNDGANTFSFKGMGFNITQCYAADMEPSAGSNKIIAGVQDNGTQQFLSPGLNSTSELTGGDGGICHIDQNNPNIQISSYVYNYYQLTTDNWNTYSTLQINTYGRFINPTDYDDNSKILYAANEADNIIRWSDIVTGGLTNEVVLINGMSSVVSAVRVSPNVPNRIYLGLGNGKILRVDNADIGTSLTGVEIFDGPAYASCIEIESGNENNIILTYSKYGTNSVYHSTDANGAAPTFTSVEGNIPDMPVRWAMINPNNPNQAFLATELGIWSTKNLNGTATVWSPTNHGLAHVRCDMIKYRPSDNTAIVASHGRGVFTASLEPCPTNVHLNSSISTDVNIEAATSITADNQINNNATVNYDSGNSIELTTDFEVGFGSVFHAYIDGCGNLLKEEDESENVTATTAEKTTTE